MSKLEILKHAAWQEWRVVRWPVLAALLFLIGVSTEVFQRAEGRLLPVVVGTDITRVTGKVDGLPEIKDHVYFYGSATRLRMCDFDHIEWFLQDGPNTTSVRLNFFERAKLRPHGDFKFGPWSANITKADLLHASYAVVYHRCHPLWLTATLFYP